MKSILKLKFILGLTVAILSFSGCEIIDQIKGDFQKSAENVTKEADRVKKELEETRNSIDRKIQKTENVLNAVSELQKELK